MSIYPEQSREKFASHYPEQTHLISHNLHEHELLTLDALAELAESLPAKDLECNAGDQPIGVDAVPEQMLDGIGERVRHIGDAGCWVGLRKVEQDPRYHALLMQMLDEIRPAIEKKTGAIINVEGYIFITSPGGVTPYHFDPEHNILFQIRGHKTMAVFPAGDPAFATDEMHEIYHTGGRPELPWRDEMAAGATDWKIESGKALYVPIMAPHYVRNGDEISISLSVTWRSEWGYAEADARAFNRRLRRFGLTPRAPGRWPATNSGKATAQRILRRIVGE